MNQKIRLRQLLANGDGRLICLTRYHSIFVKFIHTLIGYESFQGILYPSRCNGRAPSASTFSPYYQVSDFGQPL